MALGSDRNRLAPTWGCEANRLEAVTVAADKLFRDLARGAPASSVTDGFEEE
jgi:hypothetical protein